MVELVDSAEDKEASMVMVDLIEGKVMFMWVVASVWMWKSTIVEKGEEEGRARVLVIRWLKRKKVASANAVLDNYRSRGLFRVGFGAGAMLDNYGSNGYFGLVMVVASVEASCDDELKSMVVEDDGDYLVVAGEDKRDLILGERGLATSLSCGRWMNSKVYQKIKEGAFGFISRFWSLLDKGANTKTWIFRDFRKYQRGQRFRYR
ncbi:unnamed protein product [Dovyalis caffra]|uniref:Uncharacterized protein n=1 Tax=Dovyalis caffra TaxID=77055 RepID=A0AAV1SHM8_9ROSI|nr:unnamed protein product [Dovyalis caffra]